MGMTLKEKMAASLAKVAKSSGTKNIVKFEPGTHKFKLVMPAGRTWDLDDLDNSDDFFQPFMVDYSGIKDPKYKNNGPKEYYLIACVILDSRQDGIVNKDIVQYARINSMQLTALWSQVVKWPEIFDTVGNILELTISPTNVKPYATKVEADRDTWDSSKVTHPDYTIEEAAEWAGSNKDNDKPAGDAPDVTSFA